MVVELDFLPILDLMEGEQSFSKNIFLIDFSDFDWKWISIDGRLDGIR